MKFLLIIYICSTISGECYTHKEYPKVFEDHHDCVRAGLSESYEIIYAEGTFTKETINNNLLYPQFTCISKKDEGKIVT
jgi:hypothetical protein